MTKKEFKNLEVGKTFELGCRKFKVVENDNGCKGCVFNKIFNKMFDEIFDENCRVCYRMLKSNFIPECYYEDRKDKKDVIFVEVKDE